MQNCINNEEEGRNLTVRYEIDTDFTRIYKNEIKTLQHDLYEKLFSNMRYEMPNEINSMNDNDDDVDLLLYKLSKRSVQNPEDEDEIPANSPTNLTNVKHEKNSTSPKVDENLFGKNNSMSMNKVFGNSTKNSNARNIVPYETCHNITCILFCCPFGYSQRTNDSQCIPAGKMKFDLPYVYEYANDSMQNESKRVNELFPLTIYDPCLRTQRIVVDEGHQYDYKIFTDGSIYLAYYQTLFKSTSYCLSVFLNRGKEFEVNFCYDTYHQVVRNGMKYTPEIQSMFYAFNIYAGLHVVCILFMVLVFLVYSILPELRNVHGFMLRNYSAVSIVALIINIVKLMQYNAEIPYPACVTIAFLEYYFLMSTFFWLSAMSFNMWWTFRKFSSLQKKVKKKTENKKLLYYGIFAYGGPFILAILCVIVVDFISVYLPRNFRPEFKLGLCWYYAKRKPAFLLYFYGIKTVCNISSVCLSISAALKIRRYEKNTGLRLTDSESRRYNDNKKWFNLYMKLFIVLFIVLGINWIVLTLTWVFVKIMNIYLAYFIASLDIITSFCTFIIFVWKKKTKEMLLKRFGFNTNASRT
ncbi:G-protein coupled receptor Mth2-like isoform X2 [Nylanderia fulva]|uniref:G-protein coupled receptor Mth2-like isoform X2 n=1 Tax=Nylanderia fulva TaxID=613905 RepID=UPI0010FB065B|nr:G-protein coupled receptor Mth2-like isoform X2 [Nylanderia fulva]XP_029163535.1 G-protein coupled receptor Mth2-like isoform X2 [Nylanderia fulva]